jgi:hypothetical protein
LHFYSCQSTLINIVLPDVIAISIYKYIKWVSEIESL